MKVKIINNGKEIVKDIPHIVDSSRIQIEADFVKAFLERITLMKYKNSTVFNLGLIAAEQEGLSVGKDIIDKIGSFTPIIPDFSKQSIEKDIKDICKFDIGDEFFFNFMDCKLSSRELVEGIEVLLKGIKGNFEKNIILQYKIEDLNNPQNCLFRIDTK